MRHTRSDHWGVVQRQFRPAGRRNRTARAGNLLVAAAITLPVFFGLVGLAVDFGRIQLVKAELQRAADAAARYAASGLADSTALTKAQAVAAQNGVDGSGLVLSSGDVQTGSWDSSTRVFTAGGTPVNAVRVTARRSAERGTAVPMVFGRMIGRTSVDLAVTSIARAETGIAGGVVGLEGITVKNNLFVATFSSSSYTNPSKTKYASGGALGSNGAITAKKNEAVASLILGPSGSHNLSLGGGVTVLSEDIPAPAIDHSGAPAVNPGGVSKTLSVSGTVTLAGGTYSFTSISIGNNGKLQFSGPATLYVNGSVSFAQSGEIVASGSVPGNLKVYQRGAGSIFGGSNANNVTFTGDLEAPETDVAAKNNLVIRGRVVAKTIEAKNNAEIYYDSALKSTITTGGGTSGAVATVD